MEGLLVLIVISVFLTGLIFRYTEQNEHVWHGQHGEQFVSQQLHKLDQAEYKVIDNVMLPSNGRTTNTQIDHIVVSNFGIFCVETKNISGWIFGNAYHQKWTQVLYRSKYSFLNPIHQNYAHVKAIEALLFQNKITAHVFPFVAFPGATKLQVSGTHSVGHAKDVVQMITNHNVQLYSDSERDTIFDLLQRTNIKDKKIRNQHIRQVYDIQR